MGQKKGISGFTLKMIALVTMLIDHTAATILWGYIQGYEYGLCETFVNSSNYNMWYYLYLAMRGIGRMAFPIYCFLLVEGFSYTRNVKKYIGRLFVFALISEIPFDLAIFHATNGDCFATVFYYWGNKEVFWKWLKWMMTYNNVFFTLCLGLITIALMDWVRRVFPISNTSRGKYRLSLVAESFVVLLIVGAFCGLAEYVLRTDYGAAGVLAIVFMYVIGQYSAAIRQYRMLAFGAGVVCLAVTCDISEALALLMLIPIYFYNGTRGKQAKYVFYGFYPVHLLILGLLCLALGLR